MSDRRNWERFDPQDFEQDIVIHYDGQEIPGAVSNVSQGGICVVVMGDAGIPIGETLSMTFQGKTVRAIVKNITSDVVTLAYGMEWSGGPIPVV